jgi:hypothetical protein
LYHLLAGTNSSATCVRKLQLHRIGMNSHELL